MCTRESCKRQLALTKSLLNVLNHFTVARKEEVVAQTGGGGKGNVKKHEVENFDENQ